MSSYNLGTASGRIEIDGKAGAAGFKVVETAANTFFGVVQNKVQSVEAMGRKMQVAGASGVAGFGVAIKAASDFETQMSGVQAVAGGTESEFEALRQKALQLGADTTYSASEAALAIEELAKAGIPIKDILSGAAEGAVALAAAGGIGLPEAATIASNAMNQFGLAASDVTEVADILAGVANTSAADVSSLGQSLSQAGAVANLAGLSFKDTAIALGEMADAGINGSDAGTSLKTMLNNLIPTTDRQSSEFKRLNLLQYDLVDANKALSKEGLKQQSSMDGVTKVLGKYMEELDKGTVGTVKNAKAVDDFLLKQGGLNNAFFDAQGNVKNLAGLQGTLGNALKDMTRQEKLASLELLFGADAMRASAILSLAGAEGYRKFAEAVDKTSAADVAKVRLDNLSGSVESFKGAMETAMITIGSIFLPAVTKIVQGATWLINAFNNLPGPIKTAIAIIAGVVSIVLLLVGTLLASITTIGLFIAQWYAMRIIGVATAFIKAYIVAARGGAAASVAFGVATQAAATKVTFLTRVTTVASKVLLFFARSARAAWLALTGPIGIAVLAVMALVAAAVLLYQKFTPFRNLVNQVGSAIKTGLVAAWNALKPLLLATLDAFMRLGSFIASTLLPVLRSVGAMLVGKLMSGWRQISDAVMGSLVPAFMRLVGAFRTVGSDASSLWSKIAPFVQGLLRLGAVVGGFVIGVLMRLGQIFISYILPVLIRVAAFIGGVLIQTLVDLVTGIIGVISGIIKVFTGLINFVTGVFTGNWSRAWTGIKQIFMGFLGIIGNLIKVFFAVGMLKLVALGFRGLVAIVRGGWGLIRGLFRAAGVGILAILRNAFRLLVAIPRAAFNLFMAIVRGGWNVIRSIFSSFGRTIVSLIKAAWNALVNAVKIGMNMAKNFIEDGWNAARNLAESAWKRIVDAVSNGISRMIGFVREIPGRVTGAIGNLGMTLYNAGTDLIQGLINGITNKIGDAVAAVQNGLSRIKGMLPGSPIEWGPLKSWNRGGAGKRLMSMLASGMEDTTPIEKAMRSVASYINGVDLMMSPVFMAQAAKPEFTARAAAPVLSQRGGKIRNKKKKSGGGGTPKMRLVEGEFYIGPDGRVWIEGIAQDVYEENEDRKDDLDPKGGRRG